MTCKCGKPLMQRFVAVKTKQIGDDLIVEVSREAMVCDSCGVIAWGAVPKPYVFPNQTSPQARPWPLLNPATHLRSQGAQLQLVTDIWNAAVTSPTWPS